MTRPANVNFANLVKLAMRNGFANFAKWFSNFAMRNFAKLLAMGLRNLAMWFANFAMRNFAKVL